MREITAGSRNLHGADRDDSRAFTHPVMDAVPTSGGVSRAQAPSADVDFLYRVEGTSLVGESLTATPQTLETELHVSGLAEFL